MSRPTWLRRWLNSLTTPTPTIRTRPQPTRRAKVSLDRLEDRLAPAFYSVTSLAEGAGSITGGTGSQTNPFLASTLRAAITAANAANDADTITFDASLTGSVNLTTAGDATAGPSHFGISTPITVVGSPLGVTLQGNGSGRLFYVAGTGTLTLQSLTLSGGKAQGGSGGAGGGAAGMGGAVFVNQGGTLNVVQSTLTGNTAKGGDGGVTGGSNGGGGLGGTGDAAGTGGGPNGGAPNAGGSGSPGGFGGGGGYSGAGYPYFGGKGGFGGGGGGGTSYTGSRGGFGGGYGSDGRDGPAKGGGGAGLGGAIFNAAGTVTITNSTLAGNTAQGGAGKPTFGSTGGSAFGGAVFNLNGGVTLVNATLAANTVAGGSGSTVTPGGGALYTLGLNGVFASGSGTGPTVGTAAGAAVSATNTIFAAASGTAFGNQSGTVTGTKNLDAGSTGLPAGVSTTKTLAQLSLGTLANAGGPTAVVPLINGSVAIDAGTTTAPNGLTTDQRGSGFARLVNSAVDVGAYEFKLSAPFLGSPTVTALQATTATLGGTVASDGGAAITRRGVLFSATDSTPTLGEVGSGVTEVDDPASTTGTFAVNVTGLQPGTPYFFVAFATNSFGTSYTNVVAFHGTIYYVVTTLAEGAGAVTTAGHTGTAADPYEATTLRAALAAAASNSGNIGIIGFDPSLTRYGPATITLSAVGDGTAGPSAFGIYGSVAIVGPSGNNGLTLAGPGGGANGRFAYVAPAGSLTLQNLTIANFAARGGNGGGGGATANTNRTGAGGGGAGLGGAIFNEGSLTLLNSTLSGNTAVGGNGGGDCGRCGGNFYSH